MNMTLVVKGNSLTAESMTRERLEVEPMNTRPYGKNYATVVDVDIEPELELAIELAIQQWYIADVNESAPYSDGSLLFYTDKNGAFD